MSDDGNFKISYDDGTFYEGNLFRRGWGNISNEKNIKQVVFLFGGRLVKMENFRYYNLTYELHSIVGGKNPVIVNITLAGREDYRSILLVYNCKTGKLERREVEKYKEYNNWVSSTWKRGVSHGVPKDYASR